MQKLTRVLVFSLLLLSLAVAAFGQTETGQISGTVKDKTGAVVANAKVIVTAVETNVSRTGVTNSSGIYNFPSLKPALYKVTIEAAGFAKFERKAEVYVAGSVDVSATLAVGTSSTVVEVSEISSDVAVNTENQTISTVITTKDLDTLPTDANRNPYALVGLSTNVAADSNSGRGAGYAMNGERSASTSVLLDGAENVNTFTATIGQTVPLDSMQEFSVLTSNFGAEFGRASGGVINVVTKSGTNHFHGSLYEFNRVSKLSSNTEYNDQNGLPISRFTRNNFGFSLGGPVIKDKLFFFENLEWIRHRTGVSNNAVIVDPGSYSSLGANSQAYFAAFANLRSGLNLKATGPCNTSSYGSTLTCDWVNWFGQANAGGDNSQNTWDDVSKVDYNLSNKTSLSARYAGFHQQYLAGTINSSPYTGYDTGQNVFNQNITLALTHSFSPTVINTAKVVYNRLYQLQPLATAPVGPTMYSTSTVPSAPYPGFGGLQLIFPGYSQYTPGNAIPFGGPQNLYQIYDDLAISKGKHQIKIGGQYIQLRDNRVFGAYQNAVEALGKTYSDAMKNLINGNIYTFSGAINPQGEYPCYLDTNGNRIVTPACTLSLPATSPKFSRNYKYNDAAAYIQDSWKTTSHLTINAGLRWEYYGVQHNSDPSLDSNFVLGPGMNQLQRFRNGAVELAKDGGFFWRPQYGNFAPRVGFAWDPTGKGTTSVRGGISIGYERNFGNVTYNAIQNPPNYGVLSLQGEGADYPTLPVYTSNYGPLAGSGTHFFPAVSQRAINQNLKTAYAVTYNLGVEQKVFNNALFTLSYAGSHGVHQYDISNVNLAYSGYYYDFDPDGHAYTRNNLQYGAMNYRSDGGWNHYDALITSFKANNIRHSGVNVYATYQWSHTLDNLSSTFTDGNASNYGTGYWDAFNPKLDYGNADYDTRHRLVATASWDIPYLKNSKNAIERYALAGWVMSGTFSAQSGNPFTIWDCDNYNGTTCPFYVPYAGQKIPTSGVKAGSSSYEGAGVYNYITIPGPINYGDASGWALCNDQYHVDCQWTNSGLTPGHRNQFAGPKAWNLDVQILKNVKFNDKYSMQFRSQIFNIFNHQNASIIGNNLDVSGTSEIQQIKSGTRYVDFGLKFMF